MDIQTRPTSQRDHSATRRERDDSKKSTDNFSHIKGWGADLDPKNRPAYPMERTPPRLEGLHWHDVEDQPLKMKVYHSVERPGITPVFGTSTPPSGMSGKIRDVAYGFSENDVRHWILLLLADRINVVEGLGQDVMSGRIPNIFAEMGIKAEWQYNRAGLIRKAVVTSAVIGAGYLLLKRRDERPYRF